jgi:signal peptidase II
LIGNPVHTVRPNRNLVARLSSNWRIGLLALVIFVLDQVTKMVVRAKLDSGDPQGIVVLPGFFNLVHWGNTGAAWSLFRGNNATLAVVALVALLVLFLTRHHFEIHTAGGQIALGCIFGGILGNLLDRLLYNQVTDFLYFYVKRRDGVEAGFPAFNLADTAICIGVGLLLLLSWKSEPRDAESATPKS